MLEFLLAAAFLALVIGSYTDIRTREVPDWLNYSLIAAGLGARAIYSAATWEYSAILEGMLGIGLATAIAYLMFYSGQWGGGDGKMLMGIGSLVGLQPRIDSFFTGFLINLLFAGAIYGLVWSITLAIRKRSAFAKKAAQYSATRQFRTARLVAIGLAIAGIAASIWMQSTWEKTFVIALGLFTYMVVYLWLFVKSVEDSCMLKWLNPKKLTEGDWIAKEVTVDGKYISGPKDLGVTKEQIQTLNRLQRQGKLTKVLVKEGIPFVPSFLASFLLTLFAGNLLLLMLP
ncbi:MAG: prepilin peptidase [Candidatus Woesearchaeota archaeon]